jgi:bifunctional DNA-binding transcriptional regulator/antitoxin component of YhaV-PrlF toxin-antitoxin module
MSRIIFINEQGTITLPQDLIKKYGLEVGGQVLIEESEAGLILRPEITFSVEIYSDERVEEFRQSNENELEEFELQ